MSQGVDKQTVDKQAVDKLVQQWIPQRLRELHSYQVPDATGLIKLDAMENPYPWPEQLRNDWLQAMKEAELNRYPDSACTALKTALYPALGLPDDLPLLLGNGSDELIQLLIMAIAGKDRVVMAPEPSFVMYQRSALNMDVTFVGVDLNPDFSLDLAAFKAAIDQHQPALIFLAYPNNPTGNLFSAEDVREIILAAPGLVVVDEAYYPFAKASFVHEVSHYPNLLVMRTVSKMGLAGLRLGVLTGAPAWIDQLEKLRPPYNINSLTQASAQFVLTRWDIFESQVAAICAERARLLLALSAWKAISVYPSDGNFILIKLQQHDGQQLQNQLISAGILVKNLSGSHAHCQQCLRLTVGTAEENSALLAALEPLLK